jgi:aquaporin Z
MSASGQQTLQLAVAEAFGTFVLIVGGPGTAILATGAFGSSVGVIGVSLAFGLSLLAMAYTIGSISGCHINPAVTIAMWFSHNLAGRLVPIYIAAQLVGAALGGIFIAAVAAGGPGVFDADPTNFAVNGWANLSPGGFEFTSMAAVEIVLTALLVIVVLGTTNLRFPPAAAGISVGLTLTLIHLISIPVDNTSVNPARSFATAIVAGGDALEQLWAFVVFPIVGAIAGALLAGVLFKPTAPTGGLAAPAD